MNTSQIEETIPVKGRVERYRRFTLLGRNPLGDSGCAGGYGRRFMHTYQGNSMYANVYMPLANFVRRVTPAPVYIRLGKKCAILRLQTYLSSCVLVLW